MLDGTGFLKKGNKSAVVAQQYNVSATEGRIETITHLAFYAGWPNAVIPVSVARNGFSGALMPRLRHGSQTSNNAGIT